jgi:hypothetical protein
MDFRSKINAVILLDSNVVGLGSHDKGRPYREGMGIGKKAKT